MAATGETDQQTEPAAPQRRPGTVFDDRLITVDALSLNPDDIERDAADPDGQRLGDDAAEAILQELHASPDWKKAGL